MSNVTASPLVSREQRSGSNKLNVRTAARPADTPTNNGSLATWISQNSALQLVGVLANFSGILSSAAGIYSFIESYGQPSNATILNAIQQLQAALQNDFASLGDLIVQQTQVIVGTVDRDTMAQELGKADSAMDSIQDFLTNNESAALEAAKASSSEALGYFTNLSLTAPGDLAFFMPGLIKAGTVRVFAFASQPVGAREPYSVVVNDLTSMVNLLGNMVTAVSSTINSNHGITVKSHVAECPVIAQVRGASGPAFGQPHRNVTVIDGYYHIESGLPLQPGGAPVQVELAFFDAQQGNPPCEQPSPFEAGAAAAAQAARSQGVSDEQAFIGIPDSAQVLQSWTTLLNAVTATATPTVFDLNGNWTYEGATGPVITVDGNSISVDMSVYNGPTATGSILDSSHIAVTFPGDNTYAGVLQPPNTIQWSNNSTWAKA